MRSCRAHRTEIEPEERQHPKLKLTNPLCPIICPWSITSPTPAPESCRASQRHAHTWRIGLDRKQSSQELLPAGVAALLHKALNLFLARTSGHQEGIGHVDDAQVVHTKQRDQPPGAGDHNAAGSLFRND